MDRARCPICYLQLYKKLTPPEIFLWVFLFFPIFFQVARRASLAKSLFNKVIWEISTLYNSTLYHLHWCFSKNSPFENFKKSAVCNINSKQFSKQISRLKSIMQFFFSELHTKNYRFQPCAFLKLRKISEITSAVEILFYWTDDRRFALQNTCSKQFCGKLPGRSASVLKKDFTSDVSKSCWKVSKKIGAAYENSNIFY